ncbi:S1 family peptidase [Roseospira navarrensis]|uniref:S1 family peptidase n=1 Tax=Roseospira navarrensis TaxID=140058 RepID=UPI001295CDA5|nr:serine protease [Roseospira navarrensis]
MPKSIVSRATVAVGLIALGVVGYCQSATADGQRDAAEQERIDRIRRALAGPQHPVESSLRLSSIGSGFFVGRAGWILTNSHVVSGCQAVSIETPAGVKEKVRVAALSQADDLALLRAPTPAPDVAAFRERLALSDAPVAVVGYPNRGRPTITPQYVPGRATLDPARLTPRFVFQADIRRGASGGPVLDQSGAVVGVVFGAIDTPKVYEETGKVVDDLAFAVNGKVAWAFLKRSGVAPRWARATERLDEDALLERASRFVARVLCWR